MRFIAVLVALLVTLSAPAHAASRYVTSGKKPGVIVFVHGVFGNSTSTWTNSSTGAYWPSLISKDPVFKDFAVYVYEYPTPKRGVTYSINEVAENMRLTLRSDGVFDHQEIVILSHSMGGLITRALLLKYRDLSSKIRSLHFFATPTTGSEAAQIGKILSSNPQIGQMIRMDSATYLADLQRDWLAANFPFPSYCAYELRPAFGLKIVEQQSATNLCNRRLDPIDSNHIDIVKPSSISDTPYLAFRSAFLEAKAAASRTEEGGRARVDKGLVHVRTMLDRTEQGLPILDITIRNAGLTVAVVTHARITVLDRWHIGPVWVQPHALPASFQYDAAVPGRKGGSIRVPVSQELRPETADRFRIILGPSSDGEWFPPVGLFLHLLRVELEYNEDAAVVKLPQVFTHIPPPWEITAFVNPGADAARLQALLAEAKAAKLKIPASGVVDLVSVKSLDEHIRSIEQAILKVR